MLSAIQEEPFALERELQRLTEANLKEIFGLEFISSEFALHNLRIDTLAFNPETRSFVIIEYKRDQGFSVIDQGFSYLSLLLNNQADFVLEYNNHRKADFQKKDFDWSQTRVMFLSRSFTTYQQGAINFRDLPIELWEVSCYTNNSILYDQIKAGDTTTSINALSGSKRIHNISKEVKAFSEEEYIQSKPDGKGRKIYKELKERLVVIDPNLFVHSVRAHLAFRLPNNWRNIIVCMIYANKLRVDFTRSQPKDFKDPENRVKYIKNSPKYFNQHISYIEIREEKELEYAIYLIQQAYNRFLKSSQ